MQRDDGIIDVSGGRASVRVDVLDETTPYHLRIVTLLDYQIEAMLPILKHSAANCILLMFNTFRPERRQDAIGSERCAFGMPFVQATFDSNGKLNATIGAGGQKTIMSDQCWVNVFNAADLPAAIEPDTPLWPRYHVPLCVAFESVAVASDRPGGGASWGKPLSWRAEFTRA